MSARSLRVRSPESYRPTAHVPEPTDAEFALFRALIEERIGIHLNLSKRALLYGRLAPRVRDLGLRSFMEYHRLIVSAHDDVELSRMIERVTTNETQFFREPHHFTYLDEHVFPRWSVDASLRTREKRVRAWSAGCSTGEEPFSIAMALLAAFPAATGWSVEVRATDISPRVLAAARAATWPVERASHVPETLLKRFMLRGVGAQMGSVRATPELRAHVQVERLNLNDDVYADAGLFDLIFCRNVLIYFQPARRIHVIERLLSSLAPGGLLFLGHAESMHGLSGRLRCVSPTVYAACGDDVSAARKRR